MNYQISTANTHLKAGMRLLEQAAGNVTAAGEHFAAIDQEEWDQILQDAPAPMRRTLSYVRLVGQGRMIPELATASGEVAQRLRSLPVEDQGRLWVEPLEVYVPGRIGRHAKVMRYATEMTAAETRLVFERRGSLWRIRTFDEQRSWWSSQNQSESSVRELHGVDRPGRWAVRSGRVYLAAAKVSSGLTRRDLQMMLQDLEDET
jgi:hypothetical protein